MYAWIWRHLPFGLPGKIGGSLLLIVGAVSLLWFWVFPATAIWVEEFLLPFDQSTMDLGPAGDSGTVGGGDTDREPTGEFVGPDGEPIDEHDLPYDTGD